MTRVEWTNIIPRFSSINTTPCYNQQGAVRKMLPRERSWTWAVTKVGNASLSGDQDLLAYYFFSYEKLMYKLIMRMVDSLMRFSFRIHPLEQRSLNGSSFSS
jgi:hypothetical protein